MSFTLWLLGSFLALAVVEQFSRFPGDFLLPVAAGLWGALRAFRRVRAMMSKALPSQATHGRGSSTPVS